MTHVNEAAKEHGHEHPQGATHTPEAGAEGTNATAKPTAEDKAAAKAAEKAKKEQEKADKKAKAEADKAAAKAAAEQAKLAKDTKNGITRPSRGVTLLVWTTADKLSAEKKQPTDRASLVAALEGQVEVGTVHTQYGRWRKYYGLNETKEQRQKRLEAARAKKAVADAEKKQKAEADKKAKADKKAADKAAAEQAKKDKAAAEAAEKAAAAAPETTSEQPQGTAQ